MENRLAIDVSEMGKQLNISRKTAYELVNSRGFYPAFRIGRKILVNVELLKQWMKEQSDREGWS